MAFLNKKNLIYRLEKVLSENSDTKNGPYGDDETPIRLLVHKLKIESYLAKAENRTIDFKKFKYLFDKDERPFNGNYRFRVPKVKKDSINGLVGPAWALEGLIAANQVSETQEISQIINEIIYANPFDSRAKVWERKSTCGTNLGVDFTFNHQLWYCSMILRTKKKSEAVEFLNHHIPKLKLYSNGIINHYTPILAGINSVRGAQSNYYYYKNRISSYEKSLSYQAFNLLALSRCYRLEPDLPCWNSTKIKRILKFFPNERDLLIMKNSKYGEAYNPQAPGFICFFGDFGLEAKWVDQIVSTYENSDCLRRIRDYEFIDVVEGKGN